MRNHLHLTHFNRKRQKVFMICKLHCYFQMLKLDVLNPLKILKDLLEISSYHNSNHKNIYFQPRSLSKYARKFYRRILLLLACLLKKFYSSSHNHNDYIHIYLKFQALVFGCLEKSQDFNLASLNQILMEKYFIFFFNKSMGTKVLHPSTPFYIVVGQN